MGEIIDRYAEITTEFRGVAPRLFINLGAGQFAEQSSSWGLNVPSEGRGLTCFDYDHDGDIDIALLDHSTGMQFFENQTGVTAQTGYLDLKLVGESPNTDAIGARVYVLANLGGVLGWQRQMRVSEANSNFNSQNIPDLHFGLGAATAIYSLRIEWPDNTGLVCLNVDPNQRITFDQRDILWPKLDLGAPLCTWYPNIAEIAFEVIE